ncbi:Protein kinase family protein [Frankia canadensis]|uniref:Protein kinase family protein n=1 Tax=Frankia canadensis TaxID=1836972 RepID=A0A2I2KQJ2_9ACTN|nr:protein kinase [Frankia canadensis]SNQ47935.1 Protein kinase family protein [Frankia canadensis]SOU55225.1 Protein kinase family protein [Frankia canadensis]
MLTPLLEDDPRQIGPYRLQNRIGAGGMGTVYLGFTPQQRAVAVKVAAEELAEDAEFRSRFEREVRAALRVRGNAVAAVLDADTEAPVPWMVTEYVEGISLAAAVQARVRLESHLVRGLAVGLADALVAIHAAGVVHRDLKPSNILLAWDGPKVIDFGVAHLTDSSTLTRTGHVIGTLAWMSPEQMRGEPSDSSADIFAWASCVTYAATGRHPFHAETPDKLALRVQRDTPDLDAVPAYLLSLVARALSKVPRQRPTASALLASLVGRVVEGVTEADAAAGDVLERTWTGSGQVMNEVVTALPAPGPAGLGAGPPADHGAPGQEESAARPGPAPSGAGGGSGWAPAVAGPGPARGPRPVGVPPPASAFRPAIATPPPPTPIPPPPPVHRSRLTPLSPPAPAPAPAASSGPTTTAVPGARRRDRPPAAASGSSGSAGSSGFAGSSGSADHGPSVVSRWTYDVDEPDPRAPVRPPSAPRPERRASDDGWLEERERRPAAAANSTEDTIRPPDPTPPSRPPDPSTFGVGRPPAPPYQPPPSAPSPGRRRRAGLPAVRPSGSVHPARAAHQARPAPPRGAPARGADPLPPALAAPPARPALPRPAAPPQAPLPPFPLPPTPPPPVLPPPASLAPASPAPASEPAVRVPGAGAEPVSLGAAGESRRLFPPTTPVEQGLNGRALLSVVLALGWLFGLGSVAAVVVGSVARAEIRRHNQRGWRLASVGIGLGWTGIGLTATSLLVVLALR